MESKDMRSLEIYTNKDNLKNLDNWKYKKGIGLLNDSLQHTTEKVEIFLSQTSDNVILTSNILPQDHNEPVELKDDKIMLLKNDLEANNIECKLSVSDNDINKLLDK